MKTKKKAISLIVLVITIIVLTILVSTVIVSIVNSGIIDRSTSTVKNYDLAEVRSMANLAWAEALMDNTVVSDADYENFVKQYLTNAGVDITKYEITASASGLNVKSWNAIFANATQPHPDQDLEGVIGIDYKGNLVNMDLWAHGPFEEDDSIILN